MRNLITIVTLIFVFQVSSWAAVIHVPGDQPTIQSGIDTAVDGDTVLVADGSYTGDGNRDIDFLGKAISVMSENGPESCQIDCQGSFRGFYFHNNESDLSILAGFTVVNGDATGYPEPYGGAVYCARDASPSITNCRFSNNTAEAGGGLCSNSNVILSDCSSTNNTATFGGGGLYFGPYCNSAKLTNCTVSGNSSAGDGGGAYFVFYSQFTTVTNCLISDNTAVENGGGIYCYYQSSPKFTYCSISGNQAMQNGGGIFCEDVAYPKFKNCIISANQSLNGGGFYLSEQCDLEIFNCLIVGNISTQSGSGIVVLERSQPEIVNCTITGSDSASGGALQSYSASPRIKNCILWNDFQLEISASSNPPTYPATPVVSYSDIQGSFPGEGNIDADPLFVWGPGCDYYLSQVDAGQAEDSPCVDAGNPDLNLFGTTRTDHYPDTGIIDMGYHTIVIHIPTPRPTVTITPTPTPVGWTGVKLIISGDEFTSGDIFKLRAQCMGNPGDTIADLYVILDVYGNYWFHPDWSVPPDYESLNLNENHPVVSFILDFTWPSNIQGSADGLCFWGAILDPATSDLIGDFDRVEFGYY